MLSILRKRFITSKKKLEQDYITRPEAETILVRLRMVERLAYGFAGIILVAVIGAIIALVLP